jgi:hypothetical protein
MKIPEKKTESSTSDDTVFHGLEKFVGFVVIEEAEIKGFLGRSTFPLTDSYNVARL